MNENDKHKRDSVPEQFSSYEEAAAFWDTHDTTDYLDLMTPVEAEARLDQRHLEVEIDEDFAQLLREKAAKSGQSLSRVVSDLLRKQLT